MKVKLVAFGIAKEILHAKEMNVELTHGANIAELKEKLFQDYPEFAKLKSLAFAVGENYQNNHFALHENDEVVIIPPVSGG